MTKRNSGFDAPCIGGTPYPKGTKFKKNPNGTVTPIIPKKKKKETK